MARLGQRLGPPDPQVMFGFAGHVGQLVQIIHLAGHLRRRDQLVLRVHGQLRVSGSVTEICFRSSSNCASSSLCQSCFFCKAAIFWASSLWLKAAGSGSAASPASRYSKSPANRASARSISSLSLSALKFRARLLTAPELAPVNGQQFAPEKLQLAAQQSELPRHGLERLAIAFVEIGDGLEVGRQPAQQPSTSTLRRLSPPAAGTNAPDADNRRGKA